MKTITLLFLLFPLSAYSDSKPPCGGAEGKAHPNGGGFVADTAEVSGNVWVYGKARVYGLAKVYEYAKVFDNARVMVKLRFMAML